MTVDAKTGELIRLYSSAWMPEEAVERTVDAEAAQETVTEFLNELCGTQFAKTALYDSMDALEQERTISHSFTFAQQENGYFYPDNNIYVGVDATDGSISSYGKNFKDDITFDAPEGIVSMDAAIDAWLDTYTVKLGYIMVPTAIDPEHPQYQALKDYVVSTTRSAMQGWGLWVLLIAAIGVLYYNYGDNAIVVVDQSSVSEVASALQEF